MFLSVNYMKWRYVIRLAVVYVPIDKRLATISSLLVFIKESVLRAFMAECVE
jgi:hypothetical protein